MLKALRYSKLFEINLGFKLCNLLVNNLILN